ncbi:MAG: tRNA pseudouridine(38-40) synthase TruA [Burkholderiaceae bacterium]|jgi:tRNA pseudouridine38-40 synthase|nr:tRNA pseudouridine(38-40) synthase TruA [Burkholderiaceae bacterium]
MRMALGVEYDGSSWRGWQKQPDGRTVQNCLESAIYAFTQTRIATVCAGRTDAGVHALEQVVHLDTVLERAAVSWVRGVNAYLPDSVAVRWACEVPGGEGGFHARASALTRQYRYLLYNTPVRSPLLRQRAGWVFRPLQAEPMRFAVQFLLGEHDFSAFRSAECQAATPVKIVHAIDIRQEGSLFVFTFEANAFLHHMIRNIMGVLVRIGKGDHPPSWMAALLAGKDRRLSAPTFMPDGLYLSRVRYDDKWGLPQGGTGRFPFFDRDG